MALPFFAIPAAIQGAAGAAQLIGGLISGKKAKRPGTEGFQQNISDAYANLAESQDRQRQAEMASKYGYSPEQMQALQSQQQRTFATQAAQARNLGGSRGQVLGNLGANALNQAMAQGQISAEDAALQMQRQQYANQLGNEVGAYRSAIAPQRQALYDVQNAEFQQKAQGAAAMQGAGIQNIIGGGLFAGQGAGLEEQLQLQEKEIASRQPGAGLKNPANIPAFIPGGDDELFNPLPSGYDTGAGNFFSRLFQPNPKKEGGKIKDGDEFQEGGKVDGPPDKAESDNEGAFTRNILDSLSQLFPEREELTPYEEYELMQELSSQRIMDAAYKRMQQMAMSPEAMDKYKDPQYLREAYTKFMGVGVPSPYKRNISPPGYQDGGKTKDNAPTEAPKFQMPEGLVDFSGQQIAGFDASGNPIYGQPQAAQAIAGTGATLRTQATPYPAMQPLVQVPQIQPIQGALPEAAQFEIARDVQSKQPVFFGIDPATGQPIANRAGSRVYGNVYDPSVGMPTIPVAEQAWSEFEAFNKGLPATDPEGRTFEVLKEQFQMNPEGQIQIDPARYSGTLMPGTERVQPVGRFSLAGLDLSNPANLNVYETALSQFGEQYGLNPEQIQRAQADIQGYRAQREQQQFAEQQRQQQMDAILGQYSQAHPSEMDYTKLPPAEKEALYNQLLAQRQQVEAARQAYLDWLQSQQPAKPSNMKEGGKTKESKKPQPTMIVMLEIDDIMKGMHHAQR